MQVEQSSRKSGKLIVDETKSTAGLAFDEDVAARYSDNVLEMALGLKATYGSKYSDQYYLDYASRSAYIGMVERFSAPLAKRISACSIQDPDWQGYSYEEIIEMENNGVTIPQDVILWAHAQQESDIIAYEVLETEVQTDDNSTTEEVTDGYDLTGLQKKAQQYTTKAEKAQKEAAAKTEEFNILAQQAEKIKKEKQDTYKNELKQISTLSDEWKRLDEKNKTNSLSSSEQQRYQELSKTLNGSSNNSTLKEIKFDSSELDELLASMDSLDSMIVEHLETSADVIKAGEELSKYEKRFHSGLQKHSSQSYQIASPGSLASNIGTPTSSIAELAVSTGKDLELSSGEVTSLISNQASAELKEFAQDYSRAAKEALKASNQTAQNQNGQEENVNPVKNSSKSTQSTSAKSTETQGASSSTSSQQTESAAQTQSKEENELGSNIGYFVFPASGRPEAAIAATVVSAVSTADLRKKQAVVNQTEKGLKKDLKKTEADVKKLQRNNQKIEASHAANMEKVAGMNMELDNLYTQKKAEMENAVQLAKGQKRSAGSQGEIELPQQDFSQEEGIISQISAISAQDAVLRQTANLEKIKVQNSINKNEDTTKKLGEQDKQLKDRNKNNKAVSRNTIICGSLTSALGAYHMSIGVPMFQLGIKNIEIGTLMISTGWPPAVIAGTGLTTSGKILTAKAIKLIVLATAQLITGPAAITAGGVGLGASGDVSNDLKKHDQTSKESAATSLAHHKTARETDKILKNWGAIEVPALQAPSVNAQQQEEPQIESPKENGTSETKNVTFGTVKDISKPQSNSPNTIYNSMPVSGQKQNNQTTGLSQTPAMSGSAQMSQTQQQVPKSQQAGQNLQGQNQNLQQVPQKSVSQKSQTGRRGQNNNAAGSAIQSAQLQQSAQTEQTPKAQKDNIITQLRVNDIEGQAVASSANDNSNKVLKNKHSKSKNLSKKFEELNAEVQSENVQQEDNKEVKALQNEFNKDATEVDKLVQSSAARVSNAAKTSSEETSVENQDISEDDITSIIKDVYSEKEIASRTTENDDTNIIAASASTNAGVVKNTTTDDKVERKLSRFNNDSIIESRKKMKKVQAVSAASGGKGGK